MAFYVGLVASLLESSGVTGTAVPLLVYSGINLSCSIAFLVWAVIGYRFLPDHPIAEAGAQASEQKSEGEKLVQVERNRCVYCFRGQLRSHDLPG